MLSAGSRLGPYEILDQIGAGGMGQVFKARDPRLDRIVAIKVSAEQYSERFEREARAVAALNHANICTVHDVGPNYLVMEYIEGPTLAERIAAGPIPIAEALPLARQIAEALEAAHEKGIIHRDLKPANVKLTSEGKVKVLDFGLAKAFETDTTTVDPRSSPTLTLAATRAGMILGTAGYMSPEQARGVRVDKRADIWAFGVVFYEMLTGREMFSGETFSDSLAAVLRADFDWSALPADTPEPLHRVLRRCLQRDRKKRLADMADARLEIDEAIAAPPPRDKVEPPAVGLKSSPLPWAVAGILAAIALALALLHFRETPPEQRVLKYNIQPPEDVAFEVVVPSPDGRRLVFAGSESEDTRLWVQPLDSLTAQPLAGTEGASFPFWSPDSRMIGFFAEGKLKKIDASGGPPQTLCEASAGRGGGWNRNGVILFGNSGSPLQRVGAEGGEPKAVIEFSGGRGGSPRWPFFLPNGRHFLYTDTGDKPDNGGVYVASLDSKERKRLVSDYSSPAYAETQSSAGYLLFSRGGTLMAQSFDTSKGSLSGGPFPVAEHVSVNRGLGIAGYSISGSGVMVLGTDTLRQQSRLTWIDRAGKRLGTVGETGRYVQPDFSPDEKQMVVDHAGVYGGLSSFDLWMIDLTRNVSTRFTFGPKGSIAPVWSRDGKYVAFASDRDGAFELYRKIASGAGKDELLLKTGNAKYLDDWSPDGRFLLYEELNPISKYDLMLLPDPGSDRADRKPIPFLRTEFNEAHGAFSPDGKWIAYASEESGKYEVYVQPFPANGAKWQISKGGGTYPKWRHDGKEMFYLGAGFKLMAVDIKAGATLQAGTPHALFDVHSRTRFAVTRDGQRFLLWTRPAGVEKAEPSTVVINWMAGIKRQ